MEELFYLLSTKYWFRDFLIFFYRYSGRIRTFYRRPIFTKKKFLSLCRLRSAVCRLPWCHGCPNEKFVRPIFERCFQVRDFSFWITEGIGLTGVSFHFWPQEQIPSGSSHFWLLFHFNVKYWPILMLELDLM
jgi:hypothetical protein